MRRFRVFDKSSQKYVTDEKNWVLDKTGKLYAFEKGKLKEYPTCLVERGIGYLDVAIQPIYEGDIVNCYMKNWGKNADEEMKITHLVVFFDMDTASYRMYFEKHLNNKVEYEYYNFDIFNCLYSVVGNVHEDFFCQNMSKKEYYPLGLL